MGVPLLSRCDGEAIELPLWIGQLNAIASSEIPKIRHVSILGEKSNQSTSIFSQVSEEKNLRLSPSAVSEYENCPQLYKYRKIDKLPEPPSLEAERGTLVHTILQDLFEFPSQERTPQTALDLLPSRWTAQLEGKPALLEMVANEKEWLDRARSLITTYFALENPTSFEATHREMHLENDFDTDVYLHGYVDRLDIAPTGEVRIVDYKTGKSPKPGWEEKALFQLRVYALLYWKNTGVLPRLLQLIYLGDGRILKSSPTMSDIESAEKVLKRVAKDIFISIEKEYWPPKPSRLCDWCYFKSICPAHVS
ncbi:MAG: PD-(D/E)XK nuclease family protein [Candidatus Planktophila sp.]|nr:PD-(D/E)XK nuclease family protein [Candidatus Planktophila sp.]